MNYLTSGGNLYIESSDIGKDYQNTDFQDYLGIAYLDDGGESEVEALAGNPTHFTNQMLMGYYGGSSPHYSVDRITSFGGVMLQCEQDFGRMVFHQAGEYKAVSSSVVMAAMADGDSLNLKPYLMAEMIFKFLNYDPSVSVNELAENAFDERTFPNPFSDFTTIHFSQPASGLVELSVFDMQGNLIATPLNEFRHQGKHQVTWNACNSNGERISPGIYFYRIQSGGKQTTGKLTVF